MSRRTQTTAFTEQRSKMSPNQTHTNIAIVYSATVDVRGAQTSGNASTELERATQQPFSPGVAMAEVPVFRSLATVECALTDVATIFLRKSYGECCFSANKRTYTEITNAAKRETNAKTKKTQKFATSMLLIVNNKAKNQKRITQSNNKRRATRKNRRTVGHRPLLEEQPLAFSLVALDSKLLFDDLYSRSCVHNRRATKHNDQDKNHQQNLCIFVKQKQKEIKTIF